MKLLRLRVANYRGIMAREVLFARTGVTVIEGDNEAGKSSLAEAIDVLFEYRDDSSHRVVRAIQPVGQDVATEIEAEIESGPYRFSYRKRFHKERATTLDVHAPKTEHWRGREAHDRARALLAETLDEALWRALRVQQGDGLDQPDLRTQRSLAAALDEAAAGALGAEREANFVERVGDEYLRYFTATGRRNVQLETRRKAAEAAALALDEARRRLAELDADVLRHADLAADIAAAEAEVATRTAEVASAEAAVERLVEAERELRRLELEAKAAESNRAAVDSAVQERRRLVGRVRDIATQIEALEAADAATAEQRASLAVAARTATEAQERGRARLRATSELARLRRDDHAHLQDQALADQLRQSLDSQAAVIEIARAAQETLRANPVDHDTLERIEQARAAIEATKSAMVGACATVSVDAFEPATITEGRRTVTVAPGSTQERPVLGDVEIELAGGSVRVTAGAAVGELGNQLAAAEAALAAALAEAGVADYDAARLAFRRRSDAERDLRATTKARDDREAERLQAQLDTLELRLEAYRASRAPIPPMAVDADEARAIADEADREAMAAQTAAERLDEEARAANAAFDALQRDSLKATTLIEQGRLQLAADEEALREARADADDDELESRLFEQSVAATEARKAFEEAADAFQDLRPVQVKDALEESRTALRASRARLEQLTAERTGLAARIEALGEQGLHQQCVEAESAFEHAQREHEAWERRAAAVKMLHDTLGHHRDQARQAYLAPLRTRIEELGRAIFGPTFAVELDEELRIARRSLDGLTLDFDLLSAGAREQLSVLSRLACATLVAADGGVPVILDDVLGFSDPTRLARLGEVFSLARDCQVIVLTCVPERYAAVGPAAVIRLTD